MFPPFSSSSSFSDHTTIVARRRRRVRRVPNELLHEMVQCMPMGWFACWPKQHGTAQVQLGTVLGTYLAQAGAKFAAMAKMANMASKVRMLKRELARVELELKEAEQEEAEQKDATMRDLAPMKDMGVALSAQTEEFDGQRHVSLVVNYFTENWQSATRTLRSVEADNFELDAMVRETLEEFQLAEAKVVLLSVESAEVDAEMRRKMPQNVRLLPSAIEALNTILAETLGACPDSDALVRLGVRLGDVLRELKRVPTTVALVDSGASVSQARAVLGYANSAYLAVKLVSEHADKLMELLQREGREELANELGRVNRIACKELEQFLELFNRTAQFFADTKQPHLPTIAPTWFLLTRKCLKQQPMNDGPSTTPAVEAQEEPGNSIFTSMEKIIKSDVSGRGNSQVPGPSSTSTASTDTPAWVRSVRRATIQRLREWFCNNIDVEHLMPVMLSPDSDLRRLRFVCRSEQLRISVHEQIRDLVGLSRKPRPDSSEEITLIDGPPEKRQRFLNPVMGERDELDAYLQSPITEEQQRDILAFWSSVGESQFPRLARLARILLASATPIPLQQPSGSTLGQREVAALLDTAVLDLSRPEMAPAESATAPDDEQ